MNISFLRSLTILLLLALSFGSCRKNHVKNRGNSDNSKTTVAGVITNEKNQPLAGVIVHAGTLVTTSNTEGKFSISNVSIKNDRVVVDAKKDGYFDITMAGIPAKGKTTQLKLVMPERKIVATFNAAAGANGTVEGSRIEIPANAVMTKEGTAFNGSVQMAARYIDPESPALGRLMPGGDFLAVDKNQQQVSLYTYGALEVELQSTTGQDLQLKTGAEATLTMPIAASQLATAPATIPLWYFDTDKDKWVEEGFAVKQGSKYVGKVKHFTAWNCDDPNETGTVQGVIKKCDGSGMAFTSLQVGQTTTYTDENGAYSVRVPAGGTYEAKLTIIEATGSKTETFEVPPVAGTMTITVNYQEKCDVTLKGQVINQQNVPVPATVVLRAPSGTRFITTDNEGKFLTTVLANTHYEVEASANGLGSPVRSITTPAGGVMDLNKLQLQPSSQANSTLSFTVNGSVFNHQAFNLSSVFHVGDAEGYYQTSTGMSSVSKTFNDAFFNVIFTGRQPAPYPDAIITIRLANNKVLAQTQDGSLVITKYEAVGGLVQGTFSGDFLYFDEVTGQPIATVTITDGKFTLHHTNDVP